MVQWFKWLRVKIIMLFVVQEPVIPESEFCNPDDEWSMGGKNRG